LPCRRKAGFRICWEFLRTNTFRVEDVSLSAVIFDLNGVLLWDAPLHDEAWQLTARALRGARLSADEFCRHVRGRSVRHTLEYLRGVVLQGQRLHDLVALKESLYRQLCQEQGEFFTLAPGAGELLNTLQTRRIPLNLVSSAAFGDLCLGFERLGLARWFDAQLVVHSPPKPASESFVQAACKLAVEPASCLVLGYAENSLHAAREAGMGYLVGLAPTAVHAARLHAIPVDECIADLSGFPTHRVASRA